MIKLTNIEICKRTAKIEGLDFYLLESGDNTYPLIKVRDDSTLTGKDAPKKFFTAHDYNPLTDDALLNQLIIKHEVSINFHFCTLNMVTNKFYEMNFTDIPSLKRNILLLIIEAHKENV